MELRHKLLHDSVGLPAYYCACVRRYYSNKITIMLILSFAFPVQ